ncbi:hypothetical protein [Paraburkholderia sp. BL18I3N2]
MFPAKVTGVAARHQRGLPARSGD